ncbi:unnamed protein product [Hymenolepis diminuta]|uniref:C-type lectin domain-containing protein n=1 Tax=Hymenolepis diminuta TaxID=6216 RepID=A0A564ZC61_HYMDI|nr:unnamed protein product [Hymenolepis diminuta]
MFMRIVFLICINQIFHGLGLEKCSTIWKAFTNPTTLNTDRGEVICANFCYFKSSANLTYSEGDSLCKSLNTKIFRIKNQEENDDLMTLINEPIFLLTQMTENNDFTNDGEPISYGKWDCDTFSKKRKKCVKRLKTGFMTTTDCDDHLMILCDLF